MRSVLRALFVYMYLVVTVVRSTEHHDITGAARCMQATETSRSTKGNHAGHCLGLVKC